MARERAGSHGLAPDRLDGNMACTLEAASKVSADTGPGGQQVSQSAETETKFCVQFRAAACPASVGHFTSPQLNFICLNVKVVFVCLTVCSIFFSDKKNGKRISVLL